MGFQRNYNICMKDCIIEDPTLMEEGHILISASTYLV
jgi:hypothetical protein